MLTTTGGQYWVLMVGAGVGVLPGTDLLPFTARIRLLAGDGGVRSRAATATSPHTELATGASHPHHPTSTPRVGLENSV